MTGKNRRQKRIRQLETDLDHAIQQCSTIKDSSSSSSSSSAMDLVERWNQSGSTCRDADQLEEAHMYYTKALELARIMHQDSSSSCSISSLESSQESSTSCRRSSSTTTSNSSSNGGSANTDASRRSLSASIVGNLGVTASDLGRDEEAQQWYEQSAQELELDLDWQQEEGNKRKTLQETPPQQLNVAKTWNNLGTLYAKLGDYMRARQYFENALDQYFVSLAKGHSRSAFSSTLLIPNRVKHCPDVAFTYHNLGHLCLQHDRLEEAAVFLETALEIHQYCCCCHESGKPNTRAAFVTMRTTLETMGELCVELGRFSKAIEFYQQVLSLQQHQPKREEDKEHNKKPDSEAVDAVVRTTTLGILGVLYFELGNYMQAKEVLEEAVVAFLRQQQLQKSSVGVDDLAGTFDYLSRTEAKLGHPQRARRYEQQSLRLLSKSYGKAAC